MIQRSSIRRGLAAVTAIAMGTALAVVGVVAPAQAAGSIVTGGITVPQTLAEREPFTVDVSTLSISPAPTSGTYEIFSGPNLAHSVAIGYPPVVPTYELADGWGGMTMYAVLTFDSPDGPLVITSNTTDPILQEGVRPASLSISGSGIVGTPFSVQTDSSWGSTPTSIDYTWYRVDTNAVVQTGPSSTYSPTADLVGTPVYVSATATRGSLTPASSTSSFSATVRLDAFANVPAPTVSGTGLLGTDFTAAIDTSAVTPTPASVDYVWHRVDTGAVVQTGGSTLAATTALLGTGVYVIATLNAANTTSYVTPNSAFSATVRPNEFADVPTPVVSGTGVLGSEFTASLDTSAVTPTPASVDYVWHRADTDAVVQTGGDTFAPTSALLGTGVYVIATLTAADTTAYVTPNSAYSSTVRLKEFANLPTPTISGTGTLGSDYTASIDTSGITPAPDAVSFTWYRADTDAVVQVGGETFTPTFALAGTGVYVIASLTAADTAPAVTVNSPYSATVHLASFTPGDAPVLSGQHALGGELAVSIDTTGWSPIPDSFTYQWFLEDGTAIVGEQGPTLAMTPELVGEVVYVVATAHAVDTQSYEIASAPSGLIAAPEFSIDGPSSVVAGSTLTLRGWGLLFDETVEVQLQSTPVALGSFTAGSDGTLSASLTVPVLTAAGQHHLVVLRDGVEIGRVALAVTSPPAALTGTGSQDAGLGLVALAAALAIGLGLVAARRRPAAR